MTSRAGNYFRVFFSILGAVIVSFSLGVLVVKHVFNAVHLVSLEFFFLVGGLAFLFTAGVIFSGVHKGFSLEKSFPFFKKAQTSLEYLLLLVGAIMVATTAIVVLMEIASSSSEQASLNAASALCKLRPGCSGTITVNEKSFECALSEGSCLATPS